jgi:polyhydroxybutyrate depolymerase
MNSWSDLLRPFYSRLVIPVLAVLAAPVAVLAQASTGMQTISSSGAERSYLLYVPENLGSAPVPLVLNFHGSGGVPENQVRTSGFDAIAEREGFVVAFPAGAFSNTVSERSWNANVEPGVDDVQFARDIIADVSSRLNIDATRVYTTGFSGGARMSSRLACELSDLLAAAAPVAGLQYPDGCTPDRTIPVLAIHGKADQVNNYELAENSRPYWRMGVETAVERWRAANACSDRLAVSPVAENVELREWSDCAADAEIRFYVISDGGHVWPAWASEAIWAFFEAHSL